MRMETGTFELRGNDMMMRALTDAEINEVAGGGFASLAASASSGAGSTLVVNGNFALATTANTASSAVAATLSATGVNNVFSLSTTAIAP